MNDLLRSISEDNWLTQIRDYVPSAWIGHAPFMRYLFKEVKPNCFVELGTHNGFSYFVGCQTIHELQLPTKAYAVDHWYGDKHAGSFDRDVYESVVILNKKYESFSRLLKMTFLEARREAPDQIDLLHIDGLHTYDSVKEDFETWLPKMHQDGIILLHDIHVRHADFGVYKLWEELKTRFQTMEFTGSYGLGVVFLGKINGASLRELKSISDNGYLMQIQGVFGGLSDGVIQNYRLVATSDLQNKNLEMKRVITSQEHEFDQINSQYGELELLLRRIEHSKSWKWSAPLRKCVKFLRTWIR
jgi:hypothetical protein